MEIEKIKWPEMQRWFKGLSKKNQNIIRERFKSKNVNFPVEACQPCPFRLGKKESCPCWFEKR
jgi:hypothetical protein